MGQTHQEPSIKVTNRKSREWNPSALTMDPVAETQETDEWSLQAGPNAMISYEGTSVSTTYIPTESESSDTEEQLLLRYGHETRKATRVVAKKFLVRIEVCVANDLSADRTTNK